MRPYLLLAVLLSTCGSRGSDGEVEIRGRVVDDEGGTLAGTIVELRPWHGPFDDGMRFFAGSGTDAEPIAATRSDGRGRFALAAPEGGSFRLEIRARDRGSAETRLPHLVDDVELPVLRLTPAKRIAVRVVDAGGEPVAGAWVAAVSGAGRGGLPAARRARTGDDGKAAVRTSPARRVAAFAPGFVPATSTVQESGSVTLELAHGVARTIRVLGADGRAAAGVLIRLGDDGWPAGLTDADGRLTVQAPAAGGLEVTAETAEGQYGARRLPATRDTESEPVAIQLEPPATVWGRVSDAATGQPLAGVRVWLSADPGRYAESGRDGDYRISYPANRWHYQPLRAAAAGYLQQGDESIRGPSVGRRDVSLVPAVPLGGRVVDAAGQAIDGAEVTATPSWPSAGFARSRADGRFRLNGARNVLYRLEVAKSGYLTAQVEATAGAEGDARGLEVVLRRGLPGSGQVVDAGHRPVAGAEVTLTASGSGPRPRHPFVRGRPPIHRAITDPEGRFEVDNLAPGRLDLRVKARGYVERVVGGVRIADEGGVDFGTVVLELGVRLEGRVIDPQGRPLPGATLKWLAWPEGAGRTGLSNDPNLPGLTSGDDGRFAIEDLARGQKVTLEASLHGYTRGGIAGVEAPADEPVTVVLQPQGKVRGVVVDSLGQPIPEAEVDVVTQSLEGGRSSNRHRCDAEGRFEAEVDASRRLELTASSPGLRPAYRWLEVEPGQVVEGLRLVLRPGAVVEGRVLGPAGDPVAGAAVRVAKASGPAHHRDEAGTALAGDDGAFRITGLETGDLSLRASAKGYLPAHRQLEVRPGENLVEVRLRPLETHEVHGRVVDAALAPVGGAWVSLSAVDRSGGDRAVSGADGGFVAKVPEGSYRLRAGKEGFAQTEHDGEIEVAGGPLFGLEVRLDEGGTITGQILGLDPEDLATVMVGVENGYQPGTVDRDGRYRIEHLRLQEWSVGAVELSSGRQARGRAVLAPGARQAVVDLEFTPGVTLSGRVLIDGQPAPSARIAVEGVDVTTMRYAITDYRGRFHLADLPPDRYRLDVRRQELFAHRDLELSTDLDLEIELRSQGLSGRVVDAEGATPLAGALIVLEPDPGADPSRGRPPRGGPPLTTAPRTQTDSRGHFRFLSVAEGRYRLRVELAGYAPLAVPLEVAAGADLEALDLTLERAGELTLEVRTTAGGPPPRVLVAALDAAGLPVLGRWLPVTGDGDARLSGLPAGRWLLVVGAVGLGTVQLMADAPGDPVPAFLPPETRLEVHVPELAGGFERAALTVTGPGGRPFFDLSSRTRQPMREWPVRGGRATVSGLTPGPWDITVTAARGRTWSATVVATPRGGIARVDVE